MSESLNEFNIGYKVECAKIVYHNDPIAQDNQWLDQQMKQINWWLFKQ